MKPAAKDISIYRGDSYSLFFRVRKRTNEAPGDYIDLTGTTPKAQIRANEAAAEVLAEFAASLGDQVNFPGSVLLTLTPTQTAALPLSGGKWDVQIAFSATDVRTYLKGAVTVEDQVTR